MAHAHESNVKKIWMVFGLLSVVTIVEVALGIIKPDILHKSSFLGTSPLNWIFIILTLFKAYYIAWSFMHLEGGKKMVQKISSLDGNIFNLLSSNTTSCRRGLSV